MKYNVIVTIDVYVDDIEADSKEKAMQIARMHYEDYISSAEIMEINIDKETQ